MAGASNSKQAGSNSVDQARVAPLQFSTLPYQKRERFEAYRDFNASVIELSLVESPDDDFLAEQDIWDLGSFVFTQASLPGAGYVRSWRHLSKDAIDHWCLVLPAGAGDTAAQQAAPGARRHLSFRSLGRPFEGAAADTSVLTLFVPRDLFGASAGLLDQVPNEIPDTGLGQVLADYMLLLERRLPAIHRSELPALAEATRALVTACLMPSATHVTAAHDPITVTLRERARQIIRRNLRARDLGAETLCRDLGVSRSRLYRLFEPLGGVMRFIQRQRLLAAHAALSDIGDTQHIVQIAENFGFIDASGFSRAFRQEFGYTPREARDAAWAGMPRLPASGREPASRIEDLGDLLRCLSA